MSNRIHGNVLDMAPEPPLTRGRAIVHAAFILFSVLACAALVIAAALAHAPAVVVPFIACVGIGMPMLVAIEVPAVVAALRRRIPDGDVIDAFRRQLATVPEREHPLDL